MNKTMVVKSMSFPKVGIIILNWNGKEDTLQCLQSLKNIKYPNYKIFLVDNGSTDNSIFSIRQQYPSIDIIENHKNLGFAEGNNIGIKKALKENMDYILLLNNDTIVDFLFLDELIKVIESDETIGVIGPTIYFMKPEHKIQSAGVRINWFTSKNYIITSLERTKKTPKDIDYVSGCALLAKRKVFENIGYLNKNYFAYWEEADWCVRAKNSSYTIMHAPKSKIWHKGGATSKKINGFCEYHRTRNMFWFMKEHATFIQYFSFIVYFFGFKFWYSSAIFLLYYHNFTVYISYLNGIKDGIKGQNQIKI